MAVLPAVAKKGTGMICDARPRVLCAVCAQDAVVFAQINIELVSNERVLVRMWTIPLCEHCAALAQNGVDKSAIARALAGGGQ